jgi:ParB-like chromosome segregation protein Spo0J
MSRSTRAQVQLELLTGVLQLGYRKARRSQVLARLLHAASVPQSRGGPAARMEKSAAHRAAECTCDYRKARRSQLLTGLLNAPAAPQSMEGRGWHSSLSTVMM